MIKRISVSGYQSLLDVSLELGRVTCITGHSDAGKSALLRAIEDACFAQGSGDVLTVVEGEQVKQATVRIEADDAEVLWHRMVKSASYVLDRRGGASETFSRIGKAVPDEVSDALGVREVQIDSGSGPTSWARIQFVGQFDQPFLIVDRGGVAAARILGRLTGIHVFAEAAKLARQDGVGLQERRRNLDDQAAQAQAEADALVAVDQEIAWLEQIQSQVETLKFRLTQAGLLEAAIVGYLGCEQRLAEIGFRPDDLLAELEKMKPALQKLWVGLGQAESLGRVVGQAEATEARIERLRASCEGMVLPSESSVAGVRSGMAEVSRLGEVISRVEKSEQVVIQRQVELDAAQVEVDQLRRLIERIDAEIPLCPFAAQFSGSGGLYRCKELMKVINDEAKG